MPRTQTYKAYKAKKAQKKDGSEAGGPVVDATASVAAGDGVTEESARSDNADAAALQDDAMEIDEAAQETGGLETAANGNSA